MDTPIIDSLEGITILHNAGSTPELAAISGDDPASANEALNELENLLTSLTMDDEVFGQIMDAGSGIFARGEEYGFRRGFRVAARLMAESLLASETGGGKEAHK